MCNNKRLNKNLLAAALLTTLPMTALAHNQTPHPVPADKFDMMNWKITLPMDKDNNGRADEIEGVAMLSYSHHQFFFLDENDNMVFEVPNMAVTTKGSTNARSELRQMGRGTDVDISVKAPENNWVIAAHPQAESFSAVGGTIEATLKVNHVATRSKNPEKYPAYSVVVGQIHAGKDPAQLEANTGFGHGNEPLKIFYKKWPNHKMGSVFWTYERNLAKADPDRTDIAYPVWGNTWESNAEPGDKGIALGEEFSYSVKVEGNMMQLAFEAEGHPTVKYELDLSNNVDAYGKVDKKDFAKGYANEWFYFKAGAYGQCSVKTGDNFWATGCEGTGDFETDKKNGDYSSATFSVLKLNGK
ncbi:polysaccharide lyase family 7 protein [Vibrio owensii]|uniref:Alginate lyase n=1 Tax=Vibrio owensii CAIM 1854 = LMG 25443 TaxID=1229493 RepID=A0A0C1YZ26_9VIBR|nr:polysaccharide lyase family 7 protein [Vibrio owensii]KIF49279.1 alginate lyase [Vibrio owensii CAIM 1854 = LMG 25443]